MPAPKLSPTEAVLSAAAADTPEELHAARLALIATGSGVLEHLDYTLLTAGRGGAGATLLGGYGSCARRTWRITVRWRGTADLLPPEPDRFVARPRVRIVDLHGHRRRAECAHCPWTATGAMGEDLEYEAQIHRERHAAGRLPVTTR